MCNSTNSIDLELGGKVDDSRTRRRIPCSDNGPAPCTQSTAFLLEQIIQVQVGGVLADLMTLSCFFRSKRRSANPADEWSSSVKFLRFSGPES